MSNEADDVRHKKRVSFSLSDRTLLSPWAMLMYATHQLPVKKVVVSDRSHRDMIGLASDSSQTKKS